MSLDADDPTIGRASEHRPMPTMPEIPDNLARAALREAEHEQRVMSAPLLTELAPFKPEWTCPKCGAIANDVRYRIDPPGLLVTCGCGYAEWTKTRDAEPIAKTPIGPDRQIQPYERVYVIGSAVTGEAVGLVPVRGGMNVTIKAPDGLAGDVMPSYPLERVRLDRRAEPPKPIMPDLPVAHFELAADNYSRTLVNAARRGCGVHRDVTDAEMIMLVKLSDVHSDRAAMDLAFSGILRMLGVRP